MAVVFAKTLKGQKEIETRAGGLTPRVRRVLIFVDGKRSVDDLRGMLQSDDLQHTLGMLEEEGYIELAGASASGSQPASVNKAPAALPPITAFRQPLDNDPLRLQKARNFMLNTLGAFVGTLGASSLLERIETARNQGELRGHFDEWYHTIVMSRDGRRDAENLRNKLLDVI